MKKSGLYFFPSVFALVFCIFSLLSAGGGDQTGGVGGPALDVPPAEEGEAETLVVEEDAEYLRPRMFLYNTYTVVQNDNISSIAINYGLNQDTLISVNRIRNARLVPTGKVLKIPNQDGILHQVQAGETVPAIAARYNVDAETLRTANELFSDRVNAGTTVFVPGARLLFTDLQEINGDLFSWPVRGQITSRYGYRSNPFGGPRQFHTGLDIAAPMGTPVRAALPGRVTFVGWTDVLGLHVVISHHSGYRTIYGHLSSIHVSSGDVVQTGTRIGDVGNTGVSTGPHLHFTVYKNGVTTNPLALMR